MNTAYPVGKTIHAPRTAAPGGAAENAQVALIVEQIADRVGRVSALEVVYLSDGSTGILSLGEDGKVMPS